MTDWVDPLCDHRWDAAVDACSDRSFFHGSAWARVLRDAYGFAPRYVISTGGDNRRCLLPMMEIDSWLTGRRGASLPFTDECHPLCTDAGSFSDAFQTSLAYGRERRWRSIEVRGGGRWMRAAAPSLSFLGHRLEFPDAPTVLFSRLDPAVRRAIRKAEQSGLTVEFSRSLDSVRAFYRLLGKTRQRHGVPPQPFRFFAAIHRHVLERELGWVVLARLGATPVAGAVFLHSGRTAIYKFGASDEAFQQMRGNNLVMWRAIEWHAQHGFGAMDFGRTSLGNDGLRRFKLSWGTTERPIDYFNYDLAKNSFVPARDQSSGWHTRVFRMLPRSVSQWIGTALYKHIA